MRSSTRTSDASFLVSRVEATSVRDVVEAMNVNSRNLYNTFGDKHRLYLCALDHYRFKQEAEFIALFAQPGAVKEKLRQIVNSVIAESIADATRRGCFMSIAMAEMTARDAVAASRAAINFKNYERALEKSIKEAQAAGEITAKHDAAALARFFFNSLNGLRVVAKTVSDEAVLRDIVQVTLAAFE